MIVTLFKKVLRPNVKSSEALADCSSTRINIYLNLIKDASE